MVSTCPVPIEDLGDLEAAELKAINLRAQHAKHRVPSQPAWSKSCDMTFSL